MRHDGHGHGIGARVRRQETERFIQGAGTYVDDIQLPNQAYAAFVRSIAAHATIRRIDTDPARALPGILGIFTAADVTRGAGPGADPPGIAPCPLAVGKVRHVGEPIAVVVAESRYQAQDGALAVMVDYDPLAPIVDPEQAMGPEAPQVYDEYAGNVVQELHFASDDVEEVFAAADLVVSARLRTQRLAACPMEPRGVVASHDPATDEVTVWCSTSGVHGVRSRIAESLGMNETQVRVIAPDVGGSFGVKNGVYPEEIILAYLAKRVRRPVKWAETRIEHLAVGKHGRDQIHYIDLALRSDGRITGLRDRIIADLGATTRADNSVTAAFLYMTGGYDIQAVKVDAHGVATTKTPHGSVRGIGKADAAFVIERAIDIAARRLGMDPAEVRLKNFVPADAFPYRTATGAVLDSGRYGDALWRAMELAGYEQLREEQAAAFPPTPTLPLQGGGSTGPAPATSSQGEGKRYGAASVFPLSSSRRVPRGAT